MIRKLFAYVLVLTLGMFTGCTATFKDLGVVKLRDGSEMQVVVVNHERFNGNDVTVVYPYHFDHKIRRAVMLEPTSVAGPGLGKSLLPAASVAVGYAAGQALRRPDDVDIRQSNSQSGGGATAYGGDSEAHGGNPVANGGHATANGGQATAHSNGATAYGGKGGSSNSESHSHTENQPKVIIQNESHGSGSLHKKYPKRLLSPYYPDP